MLSVLSLRLFLRKASGVTLQLRYLNKIVW
jgi:hypothetical protein